MIQQIIENLETLVSTLIFASIFFICSPWRAIEEGQKVLYCRVVDCLFSVTACNSGDHSSRFCIQRDHYEHNGCGASWGKGGRFLYFFLGTAFYAGLLILI